MNRKPSWWQRYLFTTIAFVFLFKIPPSDTSGLILWAVIVYGGVTFWLRNYQGKITGDCSYANQKKVV